MLILCTFDDLGKNKYLVESKMVHWELLGVVKPFCYQVVKSRNRAPEIIRNVGLEATLSIWGSHDEQLQYGREIEVLREISGAKRGQNESLKNFKKYVSRWSARGGGR